MADSNLPLVLITGVTGFLGSHILNEFLQGEGKGKYRIRATVRDTTNDEKMKPLRDFFGPVLDSVEFVNADCNDKASLDAAVQGTDFVVHTASPVIIG